MRALNSICYAALLMGILAMPSNAQYATWTNSSGDSSWFNPQNWSSGTIPTINDQLSAGSSGLTNGGIIDLGGKVAVGEWLTIGTSSSTSGYTVQNGTLDVNLLHDSDGSSS